MFVHINLVSGKKNQDQRANEEAARTRTQYGEGNGLLIMYNVVQFLGFGF